MAASRRPNPEPRASGTGAPPKPLSRWGACWGLGAALGACLGGRQPVASRSLALLRVDEPCWRKLPAPRLANHAHPLCPCQNADPRRTGSLTRLSSPLPPRCRARTHQRWHRAGRTRPAPPTRRPISGPAAEQRRGSGCAWTVIASPRLPGRKLCIFCFRHFPHLGSHFGRRFGGLRPPPQDIPPRGPKTSQNTPKYPRAPQNTPEHPRTPAASAREAPSANPGAVAI